MKKKKYKKETKQKKEPHKEKEKRKKIVRILLALGTLLLLLLGGLFFIEKGVFEKPRETQKFTLLDECSLVLGNLLHSINEQGECRLRCKNNCEIRNLNFENSEFREEENNCHTCDCYCR
jgi:hypothetical protein